MADLSSVLRKTIDGLPNATPQLRAKVYEKARAAVQRQIAAANPPLGDDVVDARLRALEEAIASTEAHYTGGAPDAEPADAPLAPPPPGPSEAAPAPSAPAYRPEPPSYQPVPPPIPTPAPPAAFDPQPVRPMPAAAPPAGEPSPANPQLRAPAAAPPVQPARHAPYDAVSGASDYAGRDETRRDHEAHEGAPDPGEERVGEVGPVADPAYAEEAREALPANPSIGAFPDHRLHETEPGAGASLHGVPEADLTAPRYATRRSGGSRRSLYVGVAALLFVGVVGTLAYTYLDELRGALLGEEQVATGTEVPEATSAGETDAPEATTQEALNTPGPTPEPPAGEAAENAAPAEPDPGERQYTQRLLPDGTEVDEGPAANAENAFDEGTDVATATLIPQTQNPPAEAAAGAEEGGETAAAAPTQGAEGVPVGQRAVFYEERSDSQAGSQQTGNVVWSLVNEPPAAGQPAEPAIRAVADVPNENVRLTMTIRRNADETLPASHVIELLFDVPDGFDGGEIANVQRLALKPTEQARGEPLIGVAGKISDGFFIIALNDLQQAVTSNVALMRDQEWIDIPLAYSTGQRALMSLEKGAGGDEVFDQALQAWATRT